MEMDKKRAILLFLILLSLILLYTIFKWADYLSVNGYIVECFGSMPLQYNYSDSTSHTVDLPLTTTYSCTNFCGPTAKCSITGDQCSADIDCPGCQPQPQSLPYAPKKNTLAGIPGDNASGKLTVGVTPRYSPLTGGYGTRETVITSNMFSKPAVSNFGVNTWMSEFNVDQTLFNDRYKPPQIQFMPNYPERYTLTGNFIEDGPFASNAPI